jgi:hypothetical protein
LEERMQVPVPEIEFHEVTIEVPEAVARWLESEALQNVSSATTSIASDLASKGSSALGSLGTAGVATTAAAVTGATPAVKGVLEATAPIVKGAIDSVVPGAKAALESAPSLKVSSDKLSQVAAKAAEQAIPSLATTGAAAADAASQLASKTTQVAAAAKDEWLPTARQKLEGVTPVVSEKLSQSAMKATSTAALAGAGATVAAGAAKEAGSQAIGTAADATGSFLKQSVRLVVWTAVVAWLLLYVFVPDPEKRKQVYRQVRQALGLESSL